MFNQYYNGSVKKIVIAFGSLFNQIQVSDTVNGKNVITTVPLTYAPKEKFIRRLSEPSSISTGTRIETSLPRMSFEITGIVSDPSRRLNKLNTRFDYNQDTQLGSKMFAEAPYNINFTLYAYTRTIDDNLQIMEQILPYFTPEFIVSVNMNDLHQAVDTPITLVSAGLNEIYEGDFSARRYITSTYQFTVKSYIYGYIKTDIAGTIIKEADIFIWDDKPTPTPDVLLDEVIVPET